MRNVLLSSARSFLLGDLVAIAVACGCTEKGEDPAQSNEATSSPSEPTVDLPGPAMCQAVDLPEFSENGCMDDQNRVETAAALVQPEPDPPAQVTEKSWSLPCIVENVAASADCNHVAIVMSCDNNGATEQHQVSFDSPLGAELALSPGSAVEYRLDASSTVECCNQSAARIVDKSGLVYAHAIVLSSVEHSVTEAVIAQAFELLEGRRTAPICETATNAREYALELTVGSEIVAISDDTALDVGDYRVLVDEARSVEATADAPIAQFFEATVIRVSR